MSTNQPLTLTVEQATEGVGVGRSTAYELVRDGDIKCIASAAASSSPWFTSLSPWASTRAELRDWLLGAGFAVHDRRRSEITS
jgi:hypothetical protein